MPRAFDSRARSNKSSRSTRGWAQKGTNRRCYDCDGWFHFARVSPTRLEKRDDFQKPPEGHSTRTNPPREKTDTRISRTGTVKREVRETSGDNGDSSPHLRTHGNAVEKPNSPLVEQGAPSISIEIIGRARRLIVDTGSNVSYTPTGVSHSQIMDSTLKPFGVTGSS